MISKNAQENLDEFIKLATKAVTNDKNGNNKEAFEYYKRCIEYYLNAKKIGLSFVKDVNVKRKINLYMDRAEKLEKLNKIYESNEMTHPENENIEFYRNEDNQNLKNKSKLKKVKKEIFLCIIIIIYNAFNLWIDGYFFIRFINLLIILWLSLKTVDKILKIEEQKDLNEIEKTRLENERNELKKDKEIQLGKISFLLNKLEKEQNRVEKENLNVIDLKKKNEEESIRVQRELKMQQDEMILIESEKLEIEQEKVALEMEKMQIIENRKLEEEIEKLKNEKQCVICLSEMKCILFMPCAHLVSCENCQSRFAECPVCRSYIEQKIKCFN